VHRSSTNEGKESPRLLPLCWKKKRSKQWRNVQKQNQVEAMNPPMFGSPLLNCNKWTYQWLKALPTLSFSRLNSRTRIVRSARSCCCRVPTSNSKLQTFAASSTSSRWVFRTLCTVLSESMVIKLAPSVQENRPTLTKRSTCLI
jgi:hypothetical protein